ncbi:MAG: pectin acetylesterase-family hydrolase [bacterium]
MSRIAVVVLCLVAGCARQPRVAQAGEVVVDTRAPLPARRIPAARAWADTAKPLSSLSKGWNRIPGREGTGCAHDSTFAFKVRPGLPDKVMIFLNGGGACWRAAECDPKAKPTYTMTADSANDVSARTGIFDVANEKNPVRDYTMIYIPYCTGDVHLGTRTVDYEKGATRSFSVRHEGAANLEAVLDWVYSNVKNPRLVFVTGVSAGAIPTPVVAAKIARRYPRARVVQLGDAAGGYLAPDVPGLLAGWGATDYLQRDPAYRSLDSADFTFEHLYLAASRSAPRVHFAQYNAVDDATQLYFLSLLGIKNQPLTKLLAADLAQISNGTSWFHSYTAPGKTHTILRSNAMYTTKVGGVLFNDWLTQLVDGESVADVGESLLKRAKPAAPKPAASKKPTKKPAVKKRG